jgi:hypothetical protein
MSQTDNTQSTSTSSRRKNQRTVVRPDIRGIVGAASTPTADTSTTGVPAASTPSGIQDGVQAGEQRRELKSKRDRKSLYMNDSTLKKLNNAYKQLNHDVFPREVKKVDFLTAIVDVALSHGDELRTQLLGPDNSLSDGQ